MRRWAAALAAVIVISAVAAIVINKSSVPDSYDIPVLLLHHVAEEEGNAMTVTAAHLERTLAAVKDAGYTAVSTREIISYVEKGTPLPGKPVLITFDDGYESNITLAEPILQRYGMKATIFVIGVSVGKDTYKDTGIPIIPHFSWQQAGQSAVFEIQSHTHDMHHSKELDIEGYRYGVLQREGESESEYVEAFTADISMSKADIESNLEAKVEAFAYPYGVNWGLSEQLLKQLGIKMTFTIEPGVNRVEKGNSDSLYLMKRIFVYESTTPSDLLQQMSAGE